MENINVEKKVKYLQETIESTSSVLLTNEFLKKEKLLLENTPIAKYLNSNEALMDTIAVTDKIISDNPNPTTVYIRMSDYQYYNIFSKMIMYLMNSDEDIDKNTAIKYRDYCDLLLSMSETDILEVTNLILKVNNTDNVNLITVSAHWFYTIHPKIKDIRDLIDKRLSSL